jgi:hypothetical protein
MTRKPISALLFASSAICLAMAQPAAADKISDRAREAIAAAEAKIHTAETMGASSETPRDTAEARAALAAAREDFRVKHKEMAIQDAIRASALADTAIGMTQKHKDADVAAARDAQKDTAESARDQVSAARDQAAAAQDQAMTAQQRAAEADSRAHAAEQSAAASAAAASMAASQPAPAAPVVETTVTTRHATSMRHQVRTHVVRHTTTGSAPAVSDETTTTTKVTPQ